VIRGITVSADPGEVVSLVGPSTKCSRSSPAGRPDRARLSVSPEFVESFLGGGGRPAGPAGTAGTAAG